MIVKATLADGQRVHLRPHGPEGMNRLQEVTMTARAGSVAPPFSGTAYVDGGFKKVSLSDYAGQWIVVCFYPGDFTFV